MFTYKAQGGKKTYLKQYKDFKGVDLSSGVTEVEEGRSPNAPNMIADMARFPEKRPGYKNILKLEDWTEAPDTWTYAGTASFTVPGDLTAAYLKGYKVRLKQGGEGYKVSLIAEDPAFGGGTTLVTLADAILEDAAITDGAYTEIRTNFGNNINGIFPFSHGGEKEFLIHAGEKLYAITPGDSVAQAAEVYSDMNDAESAFFVMNGKLYLLDGQNYIAYDGETAAAVETNAYIPKTTISAPPEGGGEKYEDINLLQPKRINSFLGTETATEYYLDSSGIDSVEKIEMLQEDGSWIENTAYSVSTAAGKITFTTAPGISPVTGTDNVRVTFSKTVEGYAGRIKKCRIAAFYGVMSDNRIFVSGNPDYQNRDWQSGISNPEYFPDTGYSIVGSENSAIMGYIKQYDSLVIVKEDSDQDATQYLRTATVKDDGSIVYPLKQGLVGVGAVSRRAFGVLADDPMFLSRSGVFGLESDAVTYQRTTQLRSHYINRALVREGGLDRACAAIWNGWYCLFVNGKAYVASSQLVNKNKTGSTGYEWFYWTNIPAVCVREFEGDLYFGSAGGGIYKLTTYDDYGLAAYWDGGEPICARWSTKMDDMGDFMRCKTVLKRGVGIMAKPYVLSSGTIYFGNEDQAGMYANSFDSQLSTFDFADLDFARFNFNPADNPRVIPISKKLKNTGLLQVIVENDQGGQGFGIYGIQIRYVFAKDVKK